MSIERVPKDTFSQSVDAPVDAAPGQLNIGIIGAGLVGLATAAMLCKQGHKITIFESSSFHAEIGAGIVLTPNGVTVLKGLLPELVWENLQTVDFRSFENFGSDGTRHPAIDLSEGWKSYPEGWYMAHRVDLHKELMRLALDPDVHAHPAAVVRLGTPITEIDFSEHPSVTASTGEEFKFDLVVGADGIKSTVRSRMVGGEYDAPSGPRAFYRWMLDLRKNPELAWIRDDRPTSGPTSVIGKSIFLFMYPIRNGNLINISGAHLDKRPDADNVDWNEEVPKEAFLKSFEDYGEKFKPIVAVAEKPHIWKVKALPTLPTWTKGNVVLIGDAAHAMLPTYGIGFAIGLEDAATIATLLPRGTKASTVAARLKAFEEVRKPRAERVSQMSVDGIKQGGKTQFSWVVPELYDYDVLGTAKLASEKF
ncbi:FAD/NAD(P)-binding domain-containing protein [Mycena vitilis]|nr:FAD/NAD(P)-binding domain-containing protein [Mycena vitilis]